jgi:hypothetical protein
VHPDAAAVRGPKAIGSCILYSPGPPTDVKPSEIVGRYTPEEIGYVERPVRCENCIRLDEQRMKCGLFLKVNKELPEIFDCDPNVDKHDCCNGQEAKRKSAVKPSEKKPIDLWG